MDKSAIYKFRFLWYNDCEVIFVIYNGDLRDTTNFNSEKYIEINSCNVQHSRKRAHTVIRNAGRADYHILYIAEGECLCLYGDDERVLKKGEFVIYPPKTRQRYSFMEGTAVTTMWLHFSGVGISELFDELGLAGGFSSVSLPSETEHFFKRMISAHALSGARHRVLANGYLFNLLASLSAPGGESRAALYSDAVAKMVEYVNLNWQKNISVAKVAEAVNLSESRAAHLFKSALGKGIHQYAAELKISGAKELLINTDMSVSEISRMVGYADPLYFSRTFNKEVGCSPKKFRIAKNNM